MFAHGPLTASRRNQNSLAKAVIFLVAFGGPCAVYLWNARFGLRREHPSPGAGDAG